MPGTCNVLLVEDDAEDALLFATTLETRPDRSTSFDVRIATSLAAAMAMLDEADVVLLDLGLPDTEGLDGLLQLATRHPQLPVVVLTGSLDERLGEAALEHGAQDYLVKGDDDGRALSNRILFAVQRHALARQRDAARELLQRRSEQLEDANEQLVAANNLREQLVSVVSHELRTPLTPIIGFAELLERDTKLSTDTTAKASAILRNAHRLLRRVDELLLIGRARRGQLGAHRATVVLGDVVDAAVASLGAVATDVDIGGPSELRTFVDPEHLQQIIENLLHNAVKYGRPPYRIEIAEIDGHPVLSVTDHGGGIDPAFVHVMWDPFTQGTGTSSSGVGLGLAVVRLLAGANDIDIAYEPTDHGASFRLTLPGEESADSVVDAPAPMSAPSDAATAIAHDHSMTLAHSRAYLVESAVSFLLPGLERDDVVVIIARDTHLHDIRGELARSRVDLEAAIRDGRLILMDADDTLADLRSDDGELDLSHVRQALGELLRRLASGGRRVRVYGEMTSLLWDADEIPAALAIEELWNELQRSGSVRVHCTFDAAADANPAFAALTEQHTQTDLEPAEL